MPLITSSIHKHDLQGQMLSAALIIMGSNDQPSNRLQQARLLLSAWEPLEKIQAFNYLISPDHTGRAASVYHNQGLCLYFSTVADYALLLHQLKMIEHACGRDDSQNCAECGFLVALDLDILAVQIAGVWRVISERFPFKSHELHCLPMLQLL